VNATELNAMADAGGLPASGANHYYSAMDAASLMTALDGIVAGAISCTFPLSAPPADPSLLHTFVDGTEVARDPTHAMGWDYDPATNSVTLYGSTCDDARHGRLSSLNVIAGCPAGRRRRRPACATTWARRARRTATAATSWASRAICPPTPARPRRAEPERGGALSLSLELDALSTWAAPRSDRGASAGTPRRRRS